MAYTNAKRDELIDHLLARVGELEATIEAGEPIVDDPTTKKTPPAIPPNSQHVERVRLRSGKVVSRVVRPT